MKKICMLIFWLGYLSLLPEARGQKFEGTIKGTNFDGRKFISEFNFINKKQFLVFNADLQSAGRNMYSLSAGPVFFLDTAHEWIIKISPGFSRNYKRGHSFFSANFFCGKEEEEMEFFVVTKIFQNMSGERKGRIVVEGGFLAGKRLKLGLCISAEKEKEEAHFMNLEAANYTSLASFGGQFKWQPLFSSFFLTGSVGWSNENLKEKVDFPPYTVTISSSVKDYLFFSFGVGYTSKKRSLFKF